MASVWGLTVGVEGPYVSVSKDGVTITKVITPTGPRKKATFELTPEEARTMAAELLRAADECHPDDEDGPYGHCDTCGAPCDANGCTADRGHEIALCGLPGCPEHEVEGP